VTGAITGTDRWGLRARLRVGLALLVALVLATAATTVLAVRQYAAAVSAIDRDVALARKARAFGVDAREQYIHEVHTIILGDRSHVTHHAEWAGHFRVEARMLARELPADRPALDAIVQSSLTVDRAFREEILPAIDRGDRAAVRAAHDRVESAVVEMIQRADALGEHFEGRAASARATVHRRARLAAVVAILLATLAAALALVVARSVWHSIDGPITHLRAVAARITGGDTAARVGTLAVPELREVARAFDRMLDRLTSREAELVRSERLAALGRVAAGVAHEINNPIGVIRGYLKTMLREAHDESLRAELAILDEEALACQRICEDLLTWARAPAIAPEPCDLAALATDVVQRLRATGELHDVEVALGVSPCVASVDPLRMRQVVGNLLRNAAQASEGGPVELWGRRDGKCYRLRVSDRGRGIAPEVRGQLFEPFATTRSGGSGLGLAVCQGIVRAHGGDIRAEDRVGGGTTFEVTVPLGVGGAS
jgi:signal transduction histidine kinase